MFCHDFVIIFPTQLAVLLDSTRQSRTTIKCAESVVLVITSQEIHLPVVLSAPADTLLSEMDQKQETIVSVSNPAKCA